MDHDGDFGTGARMIVAAVVSAVVTATVVIAIGQTMLHRNTPPSPGPDAVLVRTLG